MRKFAVVKNGIDQYRRQIEQALKDGARADRELELIAGDEAELAGLVADEYCGTADIGQYDRRRHQITTTKAQMIEQKHRAELAVRGLAKRALDVVAEEGRQRQAAIADRIAAGEARLDQLQAEISKVAQDVAADEEALQAAEVETEAACHEFLALVDVQAARAAAARQTQRRESARWYARNRPNDPAAWPPDLRAAIAAEIEVLKAEHGEARRKLREASEQSLRALGFSPYDREWARQGRRVNT